MILLFVIQIIIYTRKDLGTDLLIKDHYLGIGILSITLQIRKWSKLFSNQFFSLQRCNIFVKKILKLPLGQHCINDIENRIPVFLIQFLDELYLFE